MFKKVKSPVPASAPEDAAPVVAVPPQAGPPAEPSPVSEPVADPVPDSASDRGPATAAYEVADFASLSEAAVIELTDHARADAEAGLVGCAHLVVTQDLSTGVVNHHVPCGSGLEALALAEQVVRDKRAEHSGRRFTVTVTPLLPHDRG